MPELDAIVSSMIGAGLPSSGNGAWPIPALGPWPAEPGRHHVIVIGAGIGGLTAAALLARRGCKVLVVEAHDRLGGCCSSWIRRARGRDGIARRFVFDAGVQDISGLGPRGPVRRLLQEIGAENKLDWRRVRHRYLLDGTCLDLGCNRAAFEAELCRLYPHEANGIAGLVREIAAIYDEIYAGRAAAGGVPAPPQTPAETIAWPRDNPRAARWLGVPFVDMLAHYVSDPALKRVLLTISEYVSDEPDRLGTIDMVPLFGYYFDGGYYPAGSSQTFADALGATVVEHGGRIELRCSACRIVLEDGRVAGIVCAGGKMDRTEHAPLVLANADVVASLTDLIDPATLPPRYKSRIERLQRGPSAVLVSLGLDMVPDLPARVFLTVDDLQLGIGNPSAIDASLAPAGCAALTLLCLLPEAEKAHWFATDRRTYRKAKADFAERLISAAATLIPRLRDHIRYLQVAAPPTFTRYLRSSNGTIYGAARGSWSPAIKTPVPGLMLVGGGVQTGPGIEAVVIAGTIAAHLIAPATPDERVGL